MIAVTRIFCEWRPKAAIARLLLLSVFPFVQLHLTLSVVQATEPLPSPKAEKNANFVVQRSQ
jgi:hypothetical protein